MDCGVKWETNIAPGVYLLLRQSPNVLMMVMHGGGELHSGVLEHHGRRGGGLVVEQKL